jgi:hypothetical protein
VFDAECAHRYLDLNALDYNTIGDALGAIIDFRDMTRLTISGLRVGQERLKGVTFDTPVAFVGSPDSIIVTFLRGIEALTSRGRRRFAFFDNPDEAARWIDSWFVTHHKDRAALRGQITTNVEPRNLLP